ncbi:hypothetical protein PCC7424_0912 [Gloeothece citriformis PCC 7424]|uniref:Uncharacterized protein n=1 Tax=Gloeothece citriformis (strain PCC 7424) TaxID=65393 RepID=B7KIG2_GLOC7|nr:hypothetical protein PCC7424_0912 [Gloeothece citriformis PCC 7424]
MRHRSILQFDREDCLAQIYRIGIILLSHQSRLVEKIFHFDKKN